MNPGRLLAFLAAYGVAFIGMHDLSALWGRDAIYSLWFPAAGLRFALIWHFGGRLTLPLALTELLAQWLMGRVDLAASGGLLFAGSIVSPAIGAGISIELAKRAVATNRALNVLPMPLALAMVAAPIGASLSSFPWHVAMGSGLEDGVSGAVVLLLVFTLGDMLGALVLAPPLLWLLQARQDALPAFANSTRHVEAIGVFGIAWGIIWAVFAGGQGLHLEPLLLAALWIGLRCGRRAAWLATVAAMIVVLQLPSELLVGTSRLSLHMLLASTALAGLLSGSFAESEARLRDDLQRRDRMLWQADRLKTLRAMSVAVIHEISQPLTTLKIEVRQLSKLADSGEAGQDQLREMSSFIRRKVDHLEQLVRTLRSFGGRSEGVADRLAVSSFVGKACDIIAAEARIAGVHLRAEIPFGLAAWGHEIELQQALVNLLRNAVSASPGTPVRISTESRGGEVAIHVENQVRAEQSATAGMGVGTIVARTIAEAHGGRLEDAMPSRDVRRFSLVLPAFETAQPEHA